MAESGRRERAGGQVLSGIGNGDKLARQGKVVRQACSAFTLYTMRSPALGEVAGPCGCGRRRVAAGKSREDYQRHCVLTHGRSASTGAKLRPLPLWSRAAMVGQPYTWNPVEDLGRTRLSRRSWVMVRGKTEICRTWPSQWRGLQSSV